MDAKISFLSDEYKIPNPELFYDDQPVECQIYHTAREDLSTAADGIVGKFVLGVN